MVFVLFNFQQHWSYQSHPHNGTGKRPSTITTHSCNGGWWGEGKWVWLLLEVDTNTSLLHNKKYSKMTRSFIIKKAIYFCLSFCHHLVLKNEHRNISKTKNKKGKNSNYIKWKINLVSHIWQTHKTRIITFLCISRAEVFRHKISYYISK